MKITLAIIATLLLGTCSHPPTILEQILEAGVLNVVTRNSPSSYYLGVDGPMGPEYDLALEFASHLGVGLYIYSVPSVADVVAELESGRAHIAAAGLTRGQATAPHIAWGPAYQRVREHLIYRMGTRRPRSLAAAAGSHIEVASASAHASTLAQMRLQEPALTWVENPHTATEDLLYRLSKGEFDYTIADTNEFGINRSFHPDIRIAFDLTPGKSLAWAVAARDDSLLDRVSAYFAGLKAENQLAGILDRYYGRTERFDYVRARDFMQHIETRLPRYRQWFREAAAEVGVDWRLLAAIGYQESHWDPHAVSPTGVRGLMMLTQGTALQVGIEDREDPEQSIFGGARYFIRVREKIPRRIAEPDRTWFALAAYNVGFGHLEDARILTQIHGRDPDRWEDVREHLPLLTQERWYTRVKHGYARGWEPVRYVDAIRGYMEILDWIASEPRETTARVTDSPPVGAGPQRTP
ncbi:MAG TPA: membrane-bound lytic murein transglycosylase MltF [Steroidobacteraceae bacterium]|nr:membrane-bound lytic murein transglycosylase MltF [Steroidobacteraceae bacterium]